MDLRKNIENNPKGSNEITSISLSINPPSSIGFIIADNAGSLNAVIIIPMIAMVIGVELFFKAIDISLL